MTAHILEGESIIIALVNSWKHYGALAALHIESQDKGRELKLKIAHNILSDSLNTFYDPNMPV